MHFNIRLKEDRQCILVLRGATADRERELIAVPTGSARASNAGSCKEVLLDVKSRGMTIDPKLAEGEGALGFWKALPQVFPTTRVQRCWVHKSANVLSKLPKRLHGQAKDLLQQIWMAPTKAAAEKRFDLFIETYQPKYTAATECLSKDGEALLAFYDFRQVLWRHPRDPRGSDRFPRRLVQWRHASGLRAISGSRGPRQVPEVPEHGRESPSSNARSPEGRRIRHRPKCTLESMPRGRWVHGSDGGRVPRVVEANPRTRGDRLPSP